MGANAERLEMIVKILSEILEKKYLKDETAPLLAMEVKKLAQNPNLSAQFQAVFATLKDDKKSNIEKAMNFQG